MQDKEWQKLNLPEKSTYIEFPIAFTGKTRSGQPSVFEGLALSCRFILAIIHTMNKAFKGYARLTYDYFVDEYGMSRETVSKAFKVLTECGIIERVKQSHYKIIAVYNKKNYIEIDTYMFRNVWNVGGNIKRLTYSRLLTLGFLKRGNENPKTGGVFISSQVRIGKAINLPKTTAGDSIRELTLAGMVKTEKPDGNDLRRRGCSQFTVNPEILAVKHPNKLDSENYKQEYNADELNKRLMLDTEYNEIIGRIKLNYDLYVSKLIKGITEDLPRLETERGELRAELDGYFKKHRIRRDFFPPGYFKCDNVNED